jgi:hypothetical protein
MVQENTITQEQTVATAADSSPVWLQRWQDGADAVASSLTAAALIAGGIWFFTRRERLPRANVEHHAIHWLSGDTLVLHLNVRVQNVGHVVMRLKSILVRVQQLTPVPDDIAALIAKGKDPVEKNESEVPWPSLAECPCDWSDACREIEPGETHECHFDFFVPADIERVEFYSYVRNVRKRRRDIGWGTTTVYSSSEGGMAKSSGSGSSGITSVNSARPTNAQEPPKKAPPAAPKRK